MFLKFFIKKNVFAFLFFFFSLAYLLSPYCNVFNLFQFRLISFFLLFVLGIFWAWSVSSNIRINFKFESITSLIILWVLIAVVNVKSLRSDISWRGDEDYHIGVVLQLLHYLTYDFWNDAHVFFIPWFIAVVLFVLILGGLVCIIQKHNLRDWVKNIPILIVAFLVIIFGISLLHCSGFGQLTVHALRYPFVERWIALFFVFLAPYSDVVLHRILPFLSCLIMATAVFYKIFNNTKDKFFSILFSFAFATLPLIYFYSSLMYLEMPVMALMTLCLMDSRALITLKIDELKLRPSWYCLLLIPFLKETVFVFCMVFIGFRLVYQMMFTLDFKVQLMGVFRELLIEVLFLMPLLIYLFFRTLFQDQSPYGMQWSNLSDFSNYYILIQSLFNQMGLFVLIGVAGFSILFKKDRLVFWFFISLFLSTTFFFIIYHHADFVGYSRWNLYFMPFFVITAVQFIVVLRKYQRYVLIIGLLISNYFLLPIHWDGARKSNWGSPKIDIAEYTYPYEEAIKYLSQGYQNKRLLILGQTYPYLRIDFYFHKYHFSPSLLQIIPYPQKFDKETEVVIFENFIMRQNSLKLLDFDIILYHSSNGTLFNDNLLYGNLFKVIKRIQNSEQSIYILKKMV